MNTPLANWARFALTFLLLVMTASALGILVYVAITTHDGATGAQVWPIVNMMVGGVIAWGGAAVNYWLGSTSAGDRKSEILGEIAKQ